MSGHRSSESGLFCCRVIPHCMMKCASTALCSTLEFLDTGPTMEHHVFDGENTGIQLKVEHISVGDYSHLLSTVFLLCIQQSLSLCS